MIARIDEMRIADAFFQFNPFGWTPPIPMWPKGNNQWAYKLYGPLNIVGAFGYRYCRNAQCNSADDGQTSGETTRGRTVSPSLAPQTVAHRVHEPCRGWERPSDHVPLVVELAL